MSLRTWLTVYNDVLLQVRSRCAGSQTLLACDMPRRLSRARRSAPLPRSGPPCPLVFKSLVASVLTRRARSPLRPRFALRRAQRWHLRHLRGLRAEDLCDDVAGRTFIVTGPTRRAQQAAGCRLCAAQRAPPRPLAAALSLTRSARRSAP